MGHGDGIGWRSRLQGKLIFAAARDITGRMEPGKRPGRCPAAGKYLTVMTFYSANVHNP